MAKYSLLISLRISSSPLFASTSTMALIYLFFNLLIYYTSAFRFFSKYLANLRSLLCSIIAGFYLLIYLKLS